MIYADTDFFLALMKESDWLKASARKPLREHTGQIWTSPATLIELLLVSAEVHLDPVRLLIDVLEIVEVRGGPATVFLEAARYMTEHDVRVFDALPASFCGRECRIISSDKVFDRLGFTRVALDQ